MPTLVAEVLRQTSGARSVHDALEVTLGLLEAEVRPTWCAIWLFDDASDTWFISHSRNLSRDAAELRFSRGGAIPCLVGEQGATRRYDTLDEEDSFMRVQEEHYRMRSALYVPMSLRGRPVGVIALYSDRPCRFTDDEQAQLELLAPHLSYVVTALSLLNERERVVELDARDRLAQDLHDGMLQILSSLRLYVHNCQESLRERDGDEVSSVVDMIGTTVEQAISEVRSSIASLRSVVVLKSAETMMKRMRGRLEAAGLNVEIPDDIPPMRPAVSDVLASVAREASNNILKHSGASNVRFSIGRDGDDILFECVDDGVGSRDRPGGGARLGLRLLFEQVGALGGTLSYDEAVGGGFVVRCRTPDGLET